MQLSRWLSTDRAQQSFQLALFADYCWRYGFNRTGQGNSASTVLIQISHIAWNHQLQLGYNVTNLRSLGCVAQTGHQHKTSYYNPNSQVPIPKDIHRSLHVNNTPERVIWGAAVLGYYYLLRRSEYLANGKQFRPYAITRTGIEVLDLTGKPCTTLSQAARVSVRFLGHKANQFGQGTVRTVEWSGSKWCCPVQAAWFLVAHHSSISVPPGSLLCHVGKDHMIQVNDLVAAIKRAVSSIGKDPRRFGSLSLRSGGATALFIAGVDSLLIKKFGRRRLDAVEFYTSTTNPLRASLAHKMLNYTT
ncbi:hypothetical protein PHMEG_0009268 [Phytophthora megakarya]|uniref:Uncharacterized protein n=1 Tax=Phytophthora megakarya TaxID=4795 RepID=A0A225WGM9_9STRA|nr:hypothetical protein PHMEG_0009268 [Phytophthora megakarya]